jgi:hypothetical protein
MWMEASFDFAASHYKQILLPVTEKDGLEKPPFLDSPWKN